MQRFFFTRMILRGAKHTRRGMFPTTTNLPCHVCCVTFPPPAEQTLSDFFFPNRSSLMAVQYAGWTCPLNFEWSVANGRSYQPPQRMRPLLQTFERCGSQTTHVPSSHELKYAQSRRMFRMSPKLAAQVWGKLPKEKIGESRAFTSAGDESLSKQPGTGLA